MCITQHDTIIGLTSSYLISYSFLLSLLCLVVTYIRLPEHISYLYPAEPVGVCRVNPFLSNRQMVTRTLSSLLNTPILSLIIHSETRIEEIPKFMNGY